MNNKEIDLSDMEIIFPTQEEEFESFYRKELMHLDNRDAIMARLRELLIKFRNNKPLMIADTECITILNEADNFVKDNFSLGFYNDFVRPHFVLQKFKNEVGDTEMIKILKLISENYNQKNEKLKKGWNHRKSQIQKVIFNLENFGLHPNLFNTQNSEPLYNVIITHNTFKQVETNKWFLMRKKQLEESIITPYQKGKKILIEGVNIPINKIQRVRISTNFFNSSQVELLALKHKFKWNFKQNEYMDYFEFCEEVTNDLLKQTAEKELIKLESEKFNQLIKKLNNCPEVKKLLKSAHKNLNHPELNRNALDDCRLALELFLKSLFNNDKSLENQNSNIGQYLEARDVSTETRNMYANFIKGYSKFQNENIKHNSVQIPQSESSSMFDLTIHFINFLIEE